MLLKCKKLTPSLIAVYDLHYLHSESDSGMILALKGLGKSSLVEEEDDKVY